MRGEAGAAADATDAGVQLARGAAMLQSLLEAVPDWVFVLDGEGTILQSSASAESALGPCARSGSPFAGLWQPAQAEALGPLLSNVGPGASLPLSLVLDARPPASARVELRLRASPKAPGTIVVVGRPLGPLPNDPPFLEAQQAGARLAASYRHVFEASPFSVIVSDAQTRFIWMNAACERMTGFRDSEMVGRTVTEAGLMDARVVDEVLGEVEALNAASLTPRAFRHRDGAPRYCISSVVQVAFEGVPLYFTLALDLTEYVQYQSQLRDQDRQFRALFDNVADGMFFADARGRFLEVNDAACKQLGYTRAELLELSLEDISDRQDSDLASLEERFDASGSLGYETCHRCKGGTRMPVGLVLTRIELRGERVYAGIARDLTAQKRFENELRDARDRLRSTLQAVPDLVFELDSDGVVHDFFSSRPELLAVAPPDFRGESLEQLTAAEGPIVIREAIRAAIERGQSTGAQYPVAGGKRWMELSVARRRDVPDADKPRVIAVARDITERKLREQELESKNDELMRFTYTVSHDLKSPLVTIKSFLGYLRQDLASQRKDKVERDLDFLEKAATRMEELLDDLLDLSRVGRQVHPPERVSLKQLLQQALEQVAGRIRDSDAEVILPETDVCLWGDRVRLLEVLQNLIDNAVKFSRDRPPVRVWVELSRHGDDYVISVRDRGVGVDARHQHKLFGLFEKLDASSEGTGIGLALVKRIIELHGGRVWFESGGVDCGAKVSFTVPGTEVQPS